jgi:uncharacterized protein
MSALTSPCIGICTLDPAGLHCVGCGRTVTEIGAWMSLGEAERRAIMAQLAERLARLRPASRA